MRLGKQGYGRSRVNHQADLFNIDHLKSRVSLHKRQTASRRSVEKGKVRDLHYATLFF